MGQLISVASADTGMNSDLIKEVSETADIKVILELIISN